MSKICPSCSKPMKQLWSSFYCDCENEVKEISNSTFSNPREAYLYALQNGSSEESRLAACKDPYYAYYYAQDVDKCPRDDTRLAACKDPCYAYYYALSVDKSPRDDTRLAACKDPCYAYYYAKDVDKSPRDDTRLVACKDPYSAYWYALNVDKCKHPDTHKAVRYSKYWEDYKKI